MGIYHDVTGLIPVRVQKPKATGPLRSIAQLLRPGVSDHYTLAAGVIANVVSVVRELRGCENLKSRAVKDLRDAVKRAGDEESIGGGVVEYPLWLGQICNGAQGMSG